MHIAILGRQPALGMAELERMFGSEAVRWFSDQSATIETEQFDISHVGGTLKAGTVIASIPSGDWRMASTKIIQTLSKEWSAHEGKITLGISAYGFPISARDVQKAGLLLKSKLKKSGVSLRLVPNAEPALNTAASHHNKLGLSDNKVELLVVRARNGRIIIASSTGAQNITAYTLRDQGRPKRDAFVGMLPPKLALQIVNLAIGQQSPSSDFEILDPFCGTGVILQEALLRGFSAMGADIQAKMVSYTSDNLGWLRQKFPQIENLSRGVQLADATKHTWETSQFTVDESGEATDATRVPMAISAIACESYLGQPFSAPPSPAKLREVRDNCNHIIIEFLKNAARQIKAGTPLCVAIPAWRDINGTFTHLPLIDQLDKLGYKRIELKNVRDEDLLYFREDQVVARELLLLEKS